MTIVSKAKENSAFIWSMLNGVGTRALSFLFFVIISRLITPADFGLMAIALAVGLLLDTLIEQGLVDALIQHPDLRDSHLGSVFVYQVGIAIFLALLLLMTAPLLAVLFHQPKLSVILPWIGYTSVFNATAWVKQAMFRREFEFKLLALRNFVATSLGGLIGLWLAYKGAGVTSLVAMYFSNALFAAIVVWISSKVSIHIEFHVQHLKDLLRFSRSILGTRVIEVLSSRLDQIAIGHYFGVEILGYYALAIRLYEVLLQTTTMPVAEVAYPLFARIQHDKVKLREGYFRLLEYAGGMTIPLFLGAAAMAPFYIPAFFGAQWIPAIRYVVIILTVGAVNSIGAYNGVLFGAVGRPDLRLKFAILGMTLWGLSAVFLLPLGGFYSSVAWAVRTLFTFPIQVRVALAQMGASMGEYFRIVLRQVTACLLMAVVIYLVASAPFSINRVWVMAMQVMLGAATYMIIASLFGSPMPKRIFQLKRILSD